MKKHWFPTLPLYRIKIIPYSVTRVSHHCRNERILNGRISKRQRCKNFWCHYNGSHSLEASRAMQISKYHISCAQESKKRIRLQDRETPWQAAFTLHRQNASLVLCLRPTYASRSRLFSRWNHLIFTLLCGKEDAALPGVGLSRVAFVAQLPRPRILLCRNSTKA